MTTENGSFPPRMTTEELKDFVLGVCDGKIWTDRHCHDERDIKNSFMILSLMEPEQLKGLENAGCIWEWISKALPMSCNGMPCFFSCHIMHKADAAVAFEAILEEEKRRKDLRLILQEKLNLKGE